MPSGPLLAPNTRLRCAAAALALAAVLLASAPAGAVSTFFAERTGTGGVPTAGQLEALQIMVQEGFLDQLDTPKTETFELFDVAAKSVLDIFSGPGITGELDDTVADSGSIRDFRDENRGFASSGTHFWKNTTTSNRDDDLFSVTFSQEVLAFGFYATAYSTDRSPMNDATRLVLYLLRDGMAPEPFEILHDPDENPGGAFYFGVIADLPFTGVALRNNSTTDPGDRIGFDDFTLAAAIVPEPATALMLLAGLLGLAAIGRRRVLSRAARLT